MHNALEVLWNLATELISLMGKAWEWLTTDLVVSIPISIPIILPDGINMELGFPPIYLVGAGLIVMFVWWIYKG